MEPVIAVGLMSGTSMDGIDAAVLTTDGDGYLTPGASLSVPYPPALRAAIAAVLGEVTPSDHIRDVERQLTLAQADAVKQLLTEAGLNARDVWVVGFHGQTITHAPDRAFTWQLGDGALMARETGIDTVYDFRQADVAAGGEGAPFAPAYHVAIAENRVKPLVVLNLGGVGNLTFIDAGGINQKRAPLAFDTGPGNAMIDDWMARHTGQSFDEGGAAALSGTVNSACLSKLLDNPYFLRQPPKSLDRNAFDISGLEGVSVADGAATLVAFTVGTVRLAFDLLPSAPKEVLVTGGGRLNLAIMQALRAALSCSVVAIEDAGYSGDMLEAQAFAYLAVRARRGLPLSYPTTTGVPAPMQGGVLAAAPEDI